MDLSIGNSIKLEGKMTDGMHWCCRDSASKLPWWWLDQLITGGMGISGKDIGGIRNSSGVAHGGQNES